MHIVYLLSEENKPQHVYSSLRPILTLCFKWYDKHRNDTRISLDFDFWLIEHGYTEEDDENNALWKEFKEDCFLNKSWGWDNEFTWEAICMD